VVLFRLPPQDVVAKIRRPAFSVLLERDSEQHAGGKVLGRIHQRSESDRRVSDARSSEVWVFSGGRGPLIPSRLASSRSPLLGKVRVGSGRFWALGDGCLRSIPGDFASAGGARLSVGSTRPPIRRTPTLRRRADWFGADRGRLRLSPHDRISAARRGSRSAWSPLMATRRRTESDDRTSSSPPFDSDADPANRMDRPGSAPSRARHEKVEGSPACPARVSPALEVEAFRARSLQDPDSIDDRRRALRRRRTPLRWRSPHGPIEPFSIRRPRAGMARIRIRTDSCSLAWTATRFDDRVHRPTRRNVIHHHAGR
jgi:hypothetical protein